MIPHKRIRRTPTSTALVAAFAAGLLAVTAGCSIRDDASAIDTAKAAGSGATDSVARTAVPEPMPAIPDSSALPVAAPRDMPPVAGETKKRPPTDPIERDSVVEPILELGPDGKVRPIKR